MKTTYTPSKSASEAYIILQSMVINSGLTTKELAEVNGCSCGYELLKKIQEDVKINIQ